MNNAEKPEGIEETPINLADAPVPLAPYWEGRTFAEGLNIPLDRDYTPEQWNWIFNQFLNLLSSEDWEIRKQAFEILKTAIESEEEQTDRENVAERLPTILQKIAQQATIIPDIFEEFCYVFSRFKEQESYQTLIFQWLQQLASDENRQQPSSEAIQAAIYYYGYGWTWQEIGTELIAALDHDDLTVRACAAYQIGQLYLSSQLNEDDEPEQIEIKQKIGASLPPITEMIELISQKEIERPGIAAAFGPPNLGVDDFNYKDWILDILEKSPHPEPYIVYFPCNLTFYAHEIFSKDPEAIRRLMNMGRVGIAIAAATDEHYQIPELEPLLIEMGYDKDLEIVRLASWHLAYHYHYLHPKGAELGYVELIDNLPEIDLFLLFNLRENSTSPYAAVIYVKDKNQLLKQEIAKKWVDKIFPPSFRGEEQKRRGGLDISLLETVVDENYVYTNGTWFEKGYTSYKSKIKNAKQNLWDNVIIGYRSDTPWNPQEFL
jgi:hypothetical protein